MALGPQKKNKAKVLAEVEKFIDSGIKVARGDRVTVATALLPDAFTCSDWHSLAEKYKAAGWRKAEWVSDQREGDYINLEA